MTSGSRTYGTFRDARSAVEREARGVASDIHAAERRMQEIVQRQGDLWKRVAAIHIDARLELPADIRRSMDARHDKIEARKAEVETIKVRLSALKRERQRAAEAQAASADTHAAGHAAAVERLDADPRVSDLRRKLAELDSSRSVAVDKHGRALRELSDKRPAYDGDEFFTYLRGRGYGTPDYSAWMPWTRMLDGALARATNFREENANYERLLANPGWHQEHVDAFAGPMREARTALDGLEAEHFAPLADASRDLEEKKAEVARIDSLIETENRTIGEANRFISDAALAEDSELRAIVDRFSAILSGQGFYDLKQLAARTETKEDDAILAELQQLEGEMKDLRIGADRRKSELHALESRVSAYEEVERHLKRKGWNDSDHSFRGIDPSSLADQIARDTVTAAAVISSLNSAHRDPPRNDHYGSSGYGSGGSTYTGGSSGGFSTSGGFGGSDSFSTTDSF